MQAIDFNDGWSYRHLDAGESFTAVRLPHDAMIGEPRHEDAPGGVNTGWFDGRDYEYVKTYAPDPELAGRLLLLEFEGVYHNAEVWVDGAQLVFRPYGYTNFRVDVTDALAAGEPREIRVVARNADQPNSRWYSGAGIYRPVTLWAGDAGHILPDGITVRTVSATPLPADGPADAVIETSVETTASGAVAIDIIDASGAVVANAQAVTRDIQPTGRGGEADVVPQGALAAALDAGANAVAVERKVRLLRACGYNAVRSAHNPCSRALLDVCDRLGVLVMDEYIDHWYIHKTQHDYVDYFNDWWRRDLNDMVRKDRSHPSVVLYSTGNEVSETAQPKGIALTQAMTDHLHGLDPTRPVTCGVNIFFNFLSSIGMGVYSDDKAAKEAAEAEKRHAAGESQKKHKAVGSEFFNNMAGLLGADFMKTGATLPFCDWKTRDAFAAMDMAGYNYGIKRYRHDLRAYPHRLILGSETFCSDAYRFRELAKREPRLVGDFVWAGIDYLGEAGVGSWEYEDYAPRFSGFGWLTAGSGRLDLTGRPLGEALYTRVALEADNGPYLAVCPVNHTGDRHSPSAWKMSNAIDSWSWNGCEGRKANVEVYARAAAVALVLNGREIGRKAMRDDCIARFSCAYEPGVLEAVSYDESGREIGRRRLVSAGKQTMLTAEIESANGELASGAVHPGRLCFVRLRYTDANGITKPLERGRITVGVEGGRLLGLGYAAPFNLDSFVSNETGTYYGEALAVIEAPHDATCGDEIVLTATDATNRTATLTVSVA